MYSQIGKLGNNDGIFKETIFKHNDNDTLVQEAVE